MNLLPPKLFVVALLAWCSVLLCAGPSRAQSKKPEAGAYGVVSGRLCRVVRQAPRSDAVYVNFADSAAGEEEEVRRGTWSAFAGYAEALSVLKRDLSRKQAASAELAAQVEGLEQRLRRSYDDTWLELMCVCLGGRDAPRDCLRPERLPELQRILSECEALDGDQITAHTRWTAFVQEYGVDLKSQVARQQREAARELEWQLLQEPISQGRVARQRALVEQADEAAGVMDALLGDVKRAAEARERLGSNYLDVYDACAALVAVCSGLAGRVAAGQDVSGELATVQGLAKEESGRAWIRAESLRASGSFRTAYAELGERRAPVAESAPAGRPGGGAAPDRGQSSRDTARERGARRSAGERDGGLPCGAIAIAVFLILLLIFMLAAT